MRIKYLAGKIAGNFRGPLDRERGPGRSGRRAGAGAGPGTTARKRGRFSPALFRGKKFRAGTVSRSRRPAAGTTGKASRKAGQKSAENGGGILQGDGHGGAAENRRGNGRGICRGRRRPCRIAAPKGFMRAVSGLYQGYIRPPYSPPQGHARAARHPCKIQKPEQQERQTGTATASTTGDRHRRAAGIAQQTQHHSHSSQPAPQRHSHHSTRQNHSRTASRDRRQRRPARR